jgi:hypothetical protein
MRQRPTIIFVGLCVFLAACSDNSQKLTKEIQDAISWIASARLVASSCAAGAVPKAYARDALDSFNQQLQSTGKRVQSIPDARTSQASAALQRAQQAIVQIYASIDHGDQLSLPQFDVQLDNEQKQLMTLVNPEERPPQHP